MVMYELDGEAFKARLAEYLDGFAADIKTGPSRGHFRDYVKGLIGKAERKNVERMAVDVGVPIHTLQEFLACYVWDEDAVRRRVQSLVATRYKDANAIAIIDETGVPKKGGKTAGVQRQYCGARGKIENSVMFVGLAYAAENFHALVDLDLYLPKAWAEDRSRRLEAGIPEDLAFRTKQDMSLRQLRAAMSGGMSFRWVTADEFYGRSSAWRQGVSELGLWYVVEIPKDVRGWLPERIGRAAVDSDTGVWEPRAVQDLWRRGGPSWATYRVKETEKGPEVWEIRVTRFVPSVNGGREGECRLLIAHNVLTGEMKYFLSNAPENCPVSALGYVAFSRWRVERCFQDLKGEVGLDHFEVHKYLPLVRHLKLALAGMLFLAIERKHLHDRGPWLWSAKAVRELVAAVLYSVTEGDFAKRWKRALEIREYYESRRQAATKSHSKKRLRKFDALGINVDTLPRFTLENLAL
jgi:SRSO17 transposase